MLAGLQAQRAGEGDHRAIVSAQCRPREAGTAPQALSHLLQAGAQALVGTNAAGQTQDFAGARFIYSRELTLPGTALVDQPMSDRLNFTANASARLRQ